MNSAIRRTFITIQIFLALILASCQPVTSIPSSPFPPIYNIESTKPPSHNLTPVPRVVTQSLPTSDPDLAYWWFGGITPSVSPIQVTLIKDISYNGEMLMDIYRPSQSGDWPVAVIFHGNGEAKWSMGELASAISSLGVVVFVPSLTTSPPKDESTGIAHITQGQEEAACSIRFARKNASSYGTSSDVLIVVGYSLGGLMGALMALAGDQFHGDCLVKEGSAVPDAFVGLDGGYDPVPFIPEEVINTDPKAVLSINPFYYMSLPLPKKEVPVYLFVGSFEPARRNGQAFRDSLQELGVSVELIQIPGVDHFDMEKPHQEVLDLITEILPILKTH
jgi:acetyl esterase/lipase